MRGIRSTITALAVVIGLLLSVVGVTYLVTAVPAQAANVNGVVDSSGSPAASASDDSTPSAPASSDTPSPTPTPTPTVSPSPRPALPPLPKTDAQVINACHATRIVNHKGADTRRGPDVDTRRWIRHVLGIGNWVELDVQHGSTMPLVQGYLFHDSHLGAGTRNGTGILSHRSDAYLDKVITRSGDPLNQYKWFLWYLSVHPDKRAQLEFKSYYDEWTAADVDWAYQQQLDRWVQGRIDDSSHWASVLREIERLNPAAYTELIGFFNQQPSLTAVVNDGINQANLTYGAAFRRYGTHKTYMAAARAMRVRVSVRSQPGGGGDSGYWWARELRAGAIALVVQGHSKKYVCDAVAHYVRHH